MKPSRGRIEITLAAVALSMLALPLSARAETGTPPGRASTLVVYGDDPCPKGEGDEIVVCARKPESERYRIPKALREDNKQLSEVAWGTRVASLEDAQRETRPNSCSVVGSGGFTGCLGLMIQQWLAERRESGR